MAVRHRNLSPKLRHRLRPEVRARRRQARLAHHLRRTLPITAEDVAATRHLLLAIAAVVAVVDLVDKAVAPTDPDFFHRRPLAVSVVMIAVTVLGVVVFPRSGSRLLGVVGGLMVGGGVGNTLSLIGWGRGIPNPIVSYRLGVAFNLADLAVGAGFLLLLPASAAFGWRHRRALGTEL
jgi:hypothetical protein